MVARMFNEAWAICVCAILHEPGLSPIEKRVGSRDSEHPEIRLDVTGSRLVEIRSEYIHVWYKVRIGDLESRPSFFDCGHGLLHLGIASKCERDSLFQIAHFDGRRKGLDDLIASGWSKPEQATELLSKLRRLRSHLDQGLLSLDHGHTDLGVRVDLASRPETCTWRSSAFSMR